MLHHYILVIVFAFAMRVGQSLRTFYDPIRNMVTTEDDSHDPNSAYDADLDAMVTATCEFENLVELGLTADNRPYRSRDCAAIQHFGFVSLVRNCIFGVVVVALYAPLNMYSITIVLYFTRHRR